MIAGLLRWRARRAAQRAAAKARAAAVIVEPVLRVAGVVRVGYATKATNESATAYLPFAFNVDVSLHEPDEMQTWAQAAAEAALLEWWFDPACPARIVLVASWSANIGTLLEPRLDGGVDAFNVPEPLQWEGDGDLPNGVEDMDFYGGNRPYASPQQVAAIGPRTGKAWRVTRTSTAKREAVRRRNRGDAGDFM